MQWILLKKQLNLLFPEDSESLLVTYGDGDEEVMVGSQTEIEYLHSIALGPTIQLKVTLPRCSKKSIGEKLISFAASFKSDWTNQEHIEFEKQYRACGPKWRKFSINGRTEKAIRAFARRELGAKITCSVDEENDTVTEVMRSKKRKIDTVYRLAYVLYSNDKGRESDG